MKQIVRYFFLLILLFSKVGIWAQSTAVYPSNWWVNMKWNQVQLLLKSDSNDFSKATVSINYAGIKLLKSTPLENSKYVSIDLAILPSAKSGTVTIQIVEKNKKRAVAWPLLPRRKGAYAQGIDASDFVYLIMPDRFANGNVANDKIAGLRDQTLNRDSVYHRHGGDLQGIINHLDYLQSLGVTAVWMTPVIENDQPNRTEHGYSMTNHYAIDARFGGIPMYQQLSDALHKRGMKLVQDAVYNHVGSKHVLYLEPPMKSWFHQWPTYTGTTYKDQPLFDPYGSQQDQKRMSDGWFTPEMPDLNQSNPYVANFLIQHALWSVEMFGVDGWRIDTYIYNDLAFMNRCNKALTDEYPKMTMFGETWVTGTAAQAYFTDNTLQIPFKSNLQGATDFQTLFTGILPALKEKFGWNEGVNKLYSTLSNDFLYTNPYRNCIFLDNHDLNRIASELGGDVAKLKMAIGWLLTCRGIPQMYYGTEVMMKGEKNPNDGYVRLDFPGGWSGDAKNAFTLQGLSDSEKELLKYTQKLGKYRQQTTALHNGKLMQYLPEDGLYVYFRYDKQKTVMCIMNTGDETKELDLAKYAERTKGFTTSVDVFTGKEIGNQFKISGKQMLILELQ